MRRRDSRMNEARREALNCAVDFNKQRQATAAGHEASPPTDADVVATAEAFHKFLTTGADD